MPRDARPSVLVLYNFVGEDEYEHLKTFDPESLDFEPEYDINVSTVTEEYHAVAKALRREGFNAHAFNVQDNLAQLERRLKRNRPDVIFNLIEFFHDDPALEQNVAGLFELYHLAYTGSRPFALALCHRKGLTKQLLISEGVPTPRFHLLRQPRLPRRPKLRYPLIVKPAHEDASSGVERESVVHDETELQARLEYVFEEFAPPILVEEFVDGTELHIAVVGNDPPEVLPPIEWAFSALPEDHPPIISFAAKWNPLSEVFHRVHTVCPARLPRRILRKVEAVALKAYQVTRCRDYARLDIRLGRKGEVYVLEVNPNPDLTEGVSLMESAEVAGYTFSQMLARIVGFALARKEAIAEEREHRANEAKEKGKPASPEAVTATLQTMADEQQANQEETQS